MGSGVGNPYHIFGGKIKVCIFFYLIEDDGNVQNLEISRQFTKVEPNGIMHTIPCQNAIIKRV
jgi:hypothetical protein